MDAAAAGAALAAGFDAIIQKVGHTFQVRPGQQVKGSVFDHLLAHLILGAFTNAAPAAAAHRQTVALQIEITCACTGKNPAEGC